MGKIGSQDALKVDGRLFRAAERHQSAGSAEAGLEVCGPTGLASDGPQDRSTELGASGPQDVDGLLRDAEEQPRVGSAEAALELEIV